MISIRTFDVEPFCHPMYKGITFVAISSQYGMLEIVHIHDSIDIALKYLQVSIIHFIPINTLCGYADFIVLGVLILYNGAGAVKRVTYELLDGKSYKNDTSLQSGRGKVNCASLLYLSFQREMLE